MPIIFENDLDIAPFYVMSVLAQAKEMEANGQDVVHLEVGEPDFKTPEPIVNRAISAMKAGDMGYTAANGILALREKIAGYYFSQFNLKINPNRIFITPGASGALQLAMKASLTQGKELLLTEPGYPCNRNIATILGIKSNICSLIAEEGYQPSVSKLESSAGKNTGALLLASPGNPTGSIVEDSIIDEISQLCRDNNWHLIMDEIYSGLTYEGHENTTILGRNPDAWVIQSFSKYFQMTGWRLGWLIVPEGYESIVTKIAQNLFLSAPTIAQFAALEAFDSRVLDLLESRRQVLDERRTFLKNALIAMGFRLAAVPNGAFYVYVDASMFTKDSLGFCQRMLEETCVAVAPGVDFGGLDGKTTIRFAYTQDLSRIEEAMNRISRFLDKLDN